jgi:hypothetical protein
MTTDLNQMRAMRMFQCVSQQHNAITELKQHAILRFWDSNSNQNRSKYNESQIYVLNIYGDSCNDHNHV